MEIHAKITSDPYKIEKTTEGDNIVSFNIGHDERILCDLFNNYYDKNLKIDIKVFRSKRTNEANRLLWRCINLLAAALNNDNWEQYLIELERYGKYTAILIEKNGYNDLKNLWRTTKVVGERIANDGRIYLEVLCFYGSSDYDLKEFSRLLDGVLSDMKDAGIILPAKEQIEEAKNNKK